MSFNNKFFKAKKLNKTTTKEVGPLPGIFYVPVASLTSEEKDTQILFWLRRTFALIQAHGHPRFLRKV